ncbi:MAG: aldo/keto reductase [Muribaculaceae bacterium]|nr:aldo/keto reductase [Muribaculaceae bacterium]
MKSNEITRRSFLKSLGAGSVVAAGSLMTGCRRAAEAVEDSHKSSSPRPAGSMTYRLNHNSGDSVSILGYGMMRLPTVKGGSARDDSSEIDQEAVNELVDYALEHGVNYFDTSPVYCKGLSERATGIALSRHPRDSYFIATKLSNFSPSTRSREESQKMFEESLRELQTDYVDYLLLHSVGSSMDDLRERFLDNGMLQWLQEQKEKGRIRNLGFSFHGDPAVYDYLLQMHDRGEAHWDFVQIQHNYSDWLNPAGNGKRSEYLYTELERRNIPAVVMEPLLGGRLAKLPKHIMQTLKTQRPDDSVASWAFRFAGTHPGILTVLSGMTYMEHLQDNILTYSPLDPCTEEEQQMLFHMAELLSAYPSIPCTRCQYCMPCPYGLDIPSIFAHYNTCVNEGNIAASASDPDYARARREFLVGYDRSVPRLRQASHCIGCGECLPHCPQQIDIPAQMVRIDTYVESLKQNA